MIQLLIGLVIGGGIGFIVGAGLMIWLHAPLRTGPRKTQA
jgi:hypothetical protein